MNHCCHAAAAQAVVARRGHDCHGHCSCYSKRNRHWIVYLSWCYIGREVVKCEVKRGEKVGVKVVVVVVGVVVGVVWGCQLGVVMTAAAFQWVVMVVVFVSLQH